MKITILPFVNEEIYLPVWLACSFTSSVTSVDTTLLFLDVVSFNILYVQTFTHFESIDELIIDNCFFPLHMSTS